MLPRGPSPGTSPSVLIASTSCHCQPGSFLSWAQLLFVGEGQREYVSPIHQRDTANFEEGSHFLKKCIYSLLLFPHRSQEPCVSER